jgi:hypothetical protein
MGITRISISYGAIRAEIEVVSAIRRNNSWQIVSGNIPSFPASGHWIYQARSVVLRDTQGNRVGLISQINLNTARASGLGYLWIQGNTNPIMCRWRIMRVI